MNRQIRQLAGALIVLHIVLFAALNYWQVGRTQQLASQPSNTRALIRQFDSPRGPIVTADGVVIARSEQVPGATDVNTPVYPTGVLFADVTGYYNVRPRLDPAREAESRSSAATPSRSRCGPSTDLHRCHDHSGEVQ
jgi:peptidoglycan glycosyltransferase